MGELLPPHAAYPPFGPQAERLARQVARALPPSLIRVWNEGGLGFLLVNEGERARYEPGPFFWRHIQARGALYLPPTCEPPALWQTVGAWLDHLAGSFGVGGRMSEGAGATPTLRDAAARWQETLARGYSAAYFGDLAPREVFPRALCAYLLDVRSLSVADPALVRWMRGTLLNEGCWRRVIAERADG